MPAGTYEFGQIRVRQYDVYANSSEVAYLGEGAVQRIAGVTGNDTDEGPRTTSLAAGGYVLAWTGQTATTGSDIPPGNLVTGRDAVAFLQGKAALDP